MLRRSAFKVDIDGQAGTHVIESAKLAFEQVDEAYKAGGDKSKGTIVCQLLKTPFGGARLQGQFLPAEYAARVAAIFTEYRDALLASEGRNPPIELQLSEGK